MESGAHDVINIKTRAIRGMIQVPSKHEDDEKEDLDLFNILIKEETKGRFEEWWKAWLFRELPDIKSTTNGPFPMPENYFVTMFREITHVPDYVLLDAFDLFDGKRSGFIHIDDVYVLLIALCAVEFKHMNNYFNKYTEWIFKRFSDCHSIATEQNDKPSARGGIEPELHDDILDEDGNALGISIARIRRLNMILGPQSVILQAIHDVQYSYDAVLSFHEFESFCQLIIKLISEVQRRIHVNLKKNVPTSDGMITFDNVEIQTEREKCNIM